MVGWLVVVWSLGCWLFGCVVGCVVMWFGWLVVWLFGWLVDDRLNSLLFTDKSRGVLGMRAMSGGL